jgi:hypothetical protein
MPAFLDPADCARKLRVSVDFIYRAIAAGRREARRHVSSGGRTIYRIEPEDLQAYLAEPWPAAPTGPR